jgi:hypothetical protein
MIECADCKKMTHDTKSASFNGWQERSQQFGSWVWVCKSCLAPKLESPLRKIYVRQGKETDFDHCGTENSDI